MARFFTLCFVLFVASDADCLAERAAAYPETAAEAAFCFTPETADLSFPLTLDAISETTLDLKPLLLAGSFDLAAIPGAGSSFLLFAYAATDLSIEWNLADLPADFAAVPIDPAVDLSL